MNVARPRLFERIKAAFEAAINGEGKETLVWIPDPVRKYTADDIVELRNRLRMTQTEFAKLLNVSIKTIEAWEGGTRKPNAAAARLLQVVEDPDAFSRIVHQREAAAAHTALTE